MAQEGMVGSPQARKGQTDPVAGLTILLSIGVVLLAVLLAPAALAAEDGTTPTGGEEWYKAATGILAIPAALLGIIISWNMVRKPRLETRKLQLEIDERQEALAKGGTEEFKAHLIAAPFSENQRAILIIIRFVLLELTLRIWNVVPEAIASIITVIGMGILLVTGFGAQGMATTVTFSLAPVVLKIMFDIVYLIILFGFGWPLFKDTAAFLNIPIKSLLELPTIAKRRNGTG
jgi:hypothetical protein